MKRRLLILGMIFVLIASLVFIAGSALQDEKRGLDESHVYSDFASSIPGERGVFTHLDDALKFKDMPESRKALEAYYRNRAYPGAPPTIPHEIDVDGTIGGKNCLQCHKNGGYVNELKAYAPLTPHPEMINCKQCHVPKNTSNLFAESEWTKVGAQPIGQAALEGSPPVIPHDLHMKSNCLSCHGGASAPVEIRVSHPDRVNCKQCHVPKNIEETFNRPFDGSNK
jgi:cytochrome c-type protein NapB